MKSLRSLTTLSLIVRNPITTTRLLKLRLNKTMHSFRVCCVVLPNWLELFVQNSEWCNSKDVYKITHWSIYPPKITIFQWTKHYQFIRKRTLVLGLFTTLLPMLLTFSSQNFPLNQCLKSLTYDLFLIITLQSHVTQIYSIIIFI